MSIRFQADNDLSRLVLTATLRAEPSIDFKTAQAARLDAVSDPDVLLFCATEDRILVSHDKRTMPSHFARFVAAGNDSPGVLLVLPQRAPIAQVVESLVLIWLDDRREDWANRITYLPF